MNHKHTFSVLSATLALALAPAAFSAPAPQVSAGAQATFSFAFRGDIQAALQSLHNMQPGVRIMPPSGHAVSIPVNIDLRGANLIDVYRAIGEAGGDQADLQLLAGGAVRIAFRDSPTTKSEERVPAGSMGIGIEPVPMASCMIGCESKQTKPTPTPKPVETKTALPEKSEKPSPRPPMIKTSAKLVDEGDALPLTDNARLSASKRWEKDGAADALIGTNGQVEYAYGQSRPTISCAPLHLCTIQLITGENVTNMAIGDSVRWMVQQATAGDRPVVVIKPTQAGLNTNLTITTDAGRVYYLTLVSDRAAYVPLVGFYDPQALVIRLDKQAADVRARKTEAEAAAKAAEEARNKRIAATVPVSDFSALDFNWSCRAEKGGDRFLPTRVFGVDGHVYLQMSERMKTDDAPAVFNVTSGEMELLNYRISGSYYIVDGEPSKLQLASGVGSAKRSVTCEHAKPSRSAWFGS
jgi:type IV secretion system protein VirB9